MYEKLKTSRFFKFRQYDKFIFFMSALSNVFNRLFHLTCTCVTRMYGMLSENALHVDESLHDARKFFNYSSGVEISRIIFSREIMSTNKLNECTIRLELNEQCVILTSNNVAYSFQLKDARSPNIAISTVQSSLVLSSLGKSIACWNKIWVICLYA